MRVTGTIALIVVMGCAPDSVPDTDDSSATVEALQARGPVAGVQDGSIDDCDGYEHYAGTDPNYELAANALGSPLWDPLDVQTVRVTVPWDLALHSDPTNVLANANAVLDVEQVCFNYWLTVMAAKGLTPAVSFKPDYNYRSADGTRIMIPSIDAYRAAMHAFVDTYSCDGGTCPLPAPPAGFTPYPAGTSAMARVGILAPWGEPDFHSATLAGLDPQAPQDFYMPAGDRRFDEPRCPDTGVSHCGPVLAAQMWVAVEGMCHDCTVIAGDFSSAGGLEPFQDGVPTYVDVYSRHLDGERPRVWGLHPYSDVESVESGGGQPPPDDETITARFASALGQLGYHERTHIWFDEVSAWYSHGTTVYGRTLENIGANYLMKRLAVAQGVTAPGDPVVTRLYYMRFEDDFPAFSLVINGAPYPPYWAIQYRAGRPAPAVADEQAVASDVVH